MRLYATMLLAFVFLGETGCASTQKKKAVGPTTSTKSEDGGGSETDAEKSDGQTVGSDVVGGHVMAENARGTYNEGVGYAKIGNLDEAQAAFKRVLQIDGKAYQAAYNLGVIAERKGDDIEAKSYYQQAFGMQPNFGAAVEAYAKLEIRSGNLNAALDLCRQKAESFPKDAVLSNIYSDVLISARRYNDAITQAKRVLRNDERNAQAMLRIGKANLKLGRKELALAILEQVLRILPDESEAYFLRSSIRAADDQRSLAITDLKTAIEKRPNYVEAMNNLATLYLISGNYNSAIELLQRAVSLSPSWGVLFLNLGNAFRGAKRWKESKEATEKALSLSPDLKGGIFNLALLYYTADELDSLDRLARLNEAKRLFARYKNELGSSLSGKDDVHKYIKEVQTAIEREETRLARVKDRAAAEAEREKQREASPSADSAASTGDAAEGETEGSGGEKEGSGGSGDDEGWF